MVLGVLGETFCLHWERRECGQGPGSWAGWAVPECAGAGLWPALGVMGSRQLQVTGVQQNFSTFSLLPIVPTSLHSEQRCPLLPPLAKSTWVLQSPVRIEAARGMGRKEGRAARGLVTDQAAPLLEPQPRQPAAV